MRQQVSKIEYGDFQTPDALAAMVVKVLSSLHIEPRTVVEPTCGIGAFILAAMRGFDSVDAVVGFEVNQTYLDIARSRVTRANGSKRVDLRCDDFFKADWQAELQSRQQPLLILGNPPWVTASGLSAIGGTNAPEKSNFQNLAGLDALTGKSNFDIAEWMILRLMQAASGANATIAMLIKTSVARRVLLHAWRSDVSTAWSHVYRFDAAKHFGIAADACLLVSQLGESDRPAVADVFSLDDPTKRISQFGLIDDMLIADVSAFQATRHLYASPSPRSPYRWRSGVKHDCAAVMELRQTHDGRYANGRDEIVDLEDDFVYPMLKGSAVAAGHTGDIDRYMIVPQQSTSEDTSGIRLAAPRTWDYLNRHKHLLDARRSSIYRKRPPFSVFGVGPYTFAPWKIAICGLYKRLTFTLVGPYQERPVVFDDTVYSIPCHSLDEASALMRLLTSDVASRFFQSFIFWDSKRPITAEILNRLDIAALAEEFGLEGEIAAANSDRLDVLELFP